MITAFKPNKPDRPRTHCLKQDKSKKKRIMLMIKTPKEASVLIAFQKPTAIWDIKWRTFHNWPYKTQNNMFEKSRSTQYTSQQSNTTHILHVIYHMDSTQRMSAISNHDFNTKPYVKAPRKLQTVVYDILPSEAGAGKRCSECGPRGTIKRLARGMHTRKYRALYKG